MKQIKYLFALIFFIFSSCTTSHITSSWKAEKVQVKKFNKILVLGLIREADRTLRENMEHHLVGDLTERGYHVVCACDEYNPKAFEKMNEKEAIDKLSNDGFDAVITIVLLDKKRERNYVPEKIYNVPGYNYNTNFWGYYSNINNRIFSPGYYQMNTKYFWESNLYDLSTKQLIYSVQTQTFNPESSDALAHEYGKLIVKDIVKSNVLEPSLKIE